MHKEDTQAPTLSLKDLRKFLLLSISLDIHGCFDFSLTLAMGFASLPIIVCSIY